MRVTTTAIGLVFSIVSIIGCAQKEAPTGNPVEVSKEQSDDERDHGAHQGPHAGQIIDLGRDHKYHAELVEDSSSGSVSIYILDGELKELPIAAASIMINVTVAGEAKTFELAAASADRASRFDSSEAVLLESLHEHNAVGKLRVTIDGTPYSGQIEAHAHAH